MPTENRLIFYATPSPLQAIASLKMALVLWRHKFTDLCSSDGLPSVWFCTKEMIAVRTWMEKQIDPYIPALGKELKQWMDYHSERIFFDTDLGWAVLRCFYHIVCYPSGLINYVATAKNLSRCEQLNDVEKYRLACTYCLEDDVRRLWPMVYCGRSKGLHNSIIKPVVHYWNNRLNKEPHCKHVCFKRILVSYTKCTRNWSAIMHFLGYLDAAEQTTHVIELIDVDPMAALYVLPRMTIDQQRQVVMKQGVAIWTYLMKKPRYSNYALRIWCFFGQFATVQQFFCLIKTTIDDKEIGLRVKTDKNEHVGGLLYDMWTYAQYNLKHYIVHNYAKYVLNVLYEDDNNMLRITYRDARFLMAVLTATSDEFKTDLWQNHWCKVIFNVPPKYLNELIGMCVKDTAEVDRIKLYLRRDIEYQKKYSRFSFKEGYFQDVDDFLNFCHVDQSEIIYLKKSLLLTVRINAYPVLELDDVEKWYALDHFIDQCYDPEEATKFRTDMVASATMQDAYDKLLLEGDLFEVCRFVDVFLTADQSSRLKEDLLEWCKKNLIQGIGYNLNEANWREFLSWCFNRDQQKIKEFKASLPIDEIVSNMLRKCVEAATKDGFFCHRKKHQICDFVKLNYFLKWYFVSWSAIKEYKKSKMEEFGSVDHIKETYKSDNDVLARILDWFSDGDTQKIHGRKHSTAHLSPTAWRNKFFKT